tara:strand:- start:760 stop:1413 length:654 start_codon:yes stop_codon:yes gene_type:complete
MNFLFSSLGKKIQIAFSGILLCLFLLLHLMNNLTLFIGSELFNSMVQTLESIKPIIRIMEFSLLMIFIMHIFNGIQVTISNKKAALSKKAESSTSSLNSRTMIITGMTILAFIIIHLRYLWYTYQAHTFLENETYYDVILRNQLGFLGHTPTAIFYIISIILIGFHLNHGFQSALKTFGISPSSRWNILYKISFIFWGLIPSLFIIIVLAIQMGYIK